MRCKRRQAWSSAVLVLRFQWMVITPLLKAFQSFQVLQLKLTIFARELD